MKTDKIIMIIAICAVVLTFANFVYTLNKYYDSRATGFATDEGTTNLTIQANAQINFTNATISWGTGVVPDGDAQCTLDTEGTNGCLDADNSVNFSTVGNGLILENIGNVNASINISSSKSAADFIGGNTPVFEWKVTENESGACDGGTLSITSYTTATTADQLACDNFGYDSVDSLNIHFNLSIPNDAVGEKGAVITAEATAIS